MAARSAAVGHSPVELLEISPVAEHNRTMATIAKNMGLVTS